MKKRIGNDIPIVWTLTDTEGNPYDLTGKEFSVCMKLEGMCVYIPMVYTFTENVISFTFYGKDQPGTGIYDIILREGDSEVTYDVQGVVELVPHSWDEDEGDITIESEIATNGEVNVIEVVKVNGVALPVVDKAVNIVIPDVSGFVDEDEMTAALAGKQDTIQDLSDIRAGAAAGATAYQKPSTGIPATDLAAGVIPDVSQFITKSVNNLVNYYLKSETYTRAEVEALIAAIPGLEFVTVATLPTASADTMNKIYCVPASNPQTQNLVDEYYTKDNGAQAQTRYTWELFGSAAIDLSGYVTTSDLNTALAAYTTTTDLTTLLAGKQDTISDLNAIRSGAAAGATAYQKPSSGIPASDIASGVIPDDAIYWATYGTTTFAALTAAWNAGKQILCFWSNRVYNLIYVGASYTFGYVWGSTTYRISCNASSEWNNTSDTNQAQITTSGILKGNGSGGVSAAVGGTDYARMTDIPAITLNGAAAASPSFYAPTTAGTQGYVLTSNGSGAPSWAASSGGSVTPMTNTEIDDEVDAAWV